VHSFLYCTEYTHLAAADVVIAICTGGWNVLLFHSDDALKIPFLSVCVMLPYGARGFRAVGDNSCSNSNSKRVQSNLKQQPESLHSRNLRRCSILISHFISLRHCCLFIRGQHSDPLSRRPADLTEVSALKSRDKESQNEWSNCFETKTDFEVE